MKKRLLFIFYLFCVVLLETNAIPAYPKRIPVVSGGDTIFITVQGDEYCKFATDEEGYTLLPSEKGWCYAAQDKNGNIVFSEHMLASKVNRSLRTEQFLQSSPKGLTPQRLNRTQSKRASSSALASKPVTGSRRVLIILMQFQDTKFSKTTDDFHRLFNEIEYTEDGAVGSVYDYYKWASYGQLELKSDILGPYTAQQSMAYYGRNQGVSGHDVNPYELFWEAIHMVAEDVNLADYDADGDGYVDNIHIIYAGYGEEAGASSNAIWAHEMTFRTITVQGMKIDRYSCAPELRGRSGKGISRIGPHCHEIGHALGAMDYYDTDYATGGSYEGTGKWDIMASGSWNNEGKSPADFNPYVKVYNYGWSIEQTLKPDEINRIGISSEKDNIYRVNTGVNNDFFLLENRDGTYFHAAEPGKGLLIFHIGPNLKSREYTNTINSTFPQQCYVVCASSEYKKPTASIYSFGDINSAGCPYPGSSGNTEFSDQSTPAALTFNGKDTGISLSDIHFEESDIVFKFGSKGPVVDPDEPSDPSDVTYLWGEDFEQLRLPDSWTYENLIGTGELSVSTKLSLNDLPYSPLAASGSGYATYIPIQQMMVGEYRTSGILCSPRIRLGEGKKYQLSFSTRKYNQKKNNSLDKLIVCLMYDEGVEDTVACHEIMSQNSWEKVMVVLPENLFDFSIKMLCDIDYGSTMFIDHIAISEHHEKTGIADNSMVSSYRVNGNNLYVNPQGSAVSIFTISGVCIYKNTRKTDREIAINLKRGYYIISMGNIRKKVFIGY